MRILPKPLSITFCALGVLVASVGGYNLPAAAATCASLPTDKGTAKESFTVTASGTYQLWAHVYAPASGATALDMAIDNGCPMNVGGRKATPNSFSWTNQGNSTTSVSVTLASGKHTLTVAGKDASVGIDRVLLLTNNGCVPTADGSNCMASSAPTTPTSSPPTSNAPGHHLSVATRGYYIAMSAFFAALLGFLLLRYAVRHSNLLTRIPLLKRSLSGSSPTTLLAMTGPVVTGTVMPTTNALRIAPNRKHTVLFVLGFGIAGALVCFIALAAPHDNIIIDLPSATTSGQAKIVTNAHAINGHMLQFGSNAVASKSAPKPPAPTPSKTQSGNNSQGGTSKKSPGPPAGGTGSPPPPPSPPPPAPPASSNCTNPSWSTNNAEGTESIGSDDVWWVNNDAWNGSHGPQTIYACSQSSWYAVSNQTNNGGAVETYPDTEYDIAGRGNATKTIAQYNSITSTFAENFPSAGSWDAAYDLWLNNWSTEIMIWNQWTGTQLYWPSDKSITVTLGGVPYWFQNNGGEFIFYRQNMVSSGSVDILAALKYLTSKGLVKSSDVPTQLEYGVEVCSTNGNETFPLTGLTFSVN